MKIYTYDPETKEFVSEAQARPDPEEHGRFLVPANAATIAPPASKPNKRAVWTGTYWKIVPDYRGIRYWLMNGSEHEIRDLGVDLPAGAQLAMPVNKNEEEEKQQELKSHIEDLLDKTAQERGYADMLTICTYGDTGNARYDSEAEAFKKWRSQVWAHFYSMMNEIMAEKRAMPTAEEMMSLLPAISWPH